MDSLIKSEADKARDLDATFLSCGRNACRPSDLYFKMCSLEKIMETLEARNLNRLRKGKMMLVFAKEKKSFGLALLLTVLVGWSGAHRFYLGHHLIGAGFVICSIIVALGIALAGADLHHPIMGGVLISANILMTAVLIEMVLSFWVVGRENDRIKARLAKEYDVQDMKVPF